MCSCGQNHHFLKVWTRLLQSRSLEKRQDVGSESERQRAAGPPEAGQVLSPQGSCLGGAHVPPGPLKIPTGLPGRWTPWVGAGLVACAAVACEWPSEIPESRLHCPPFLMIQLRKNTCFPKSPGLLLRQHTRNIQVTWEPSQVHSCDLTPACILVWLAPPVRRRDCSISPARALRPSNTDSHFPPRQPPAATILLSVCKFDYLE